MSISILLYNITIFNIFENQLVEFVFCCFFYSRSTAVSESTPEEEKQRQDEGSLRVPSPLVHGRISSDESEAEGPEEPVEFPSSAAPPRPLAVSSLFLDLTVGKENEGIPTKRI